MQHAHSGMRLARKVVLSGVPGFWIVPGQIVGLRRLAVICRSDHRD